MSNRIVNIEQSHTERRSCLGGTTPEEHRQLMASVFRHDRLSSRT